MKNLGSRKTTGSSGATSQAQADKTCPSFSYGQGGQTNNGVNFSTYTIKNGVVSQLQQSESFPSSSISVVVV